VSLRLTSSPSSARDLETVNFICLRMMDKDSFLHHKNRQMDYVLRTLGHEVST
jgi:hypothetical protein